MVILNFIANICTVIHDHSNTTAFLHGIILQEESSLLNQKVKAHLKFCPAQYEIKDILELG